MAQRTVVILRGNAAKAGSYPDEQGKPIVHPDEFGNQATH